MAENKYDNETFFKKYLAMDRSIKGLAAAGEWETLKTLLPKLKNLNVLDLGCGLGWHCFYAAEQGAKKVLGIDISQKMLEIACQKNVFCDIVSFEKCDIEEINFINNSFDLIFSSLTFHYINDFSLVVQKITNFLKVNQYFIFSVEHPIFTAEGSENWCYNEKKQISHWPVDNYFIEGERQTLFLGEKVIKYHRTLTTYINILINHGFVIESINEPQPSENLKNELIMKNEFRRPMMLIIKAKLIKKR